MRISKASISVGAIVTLAVALAMIVTLRIAATREKESSLGKVFTYDLKELRKTDPALIKYKESGKISTGFEHVRAVDVAGDIYVAGDKSIRIFDNSGNALSEIELADAPRCLAVDDDGTVYAGMRDHIEVYDSSGKRKARWESLGENAVLTSVAVSEGDVFAADAGGRVVLRYDSSGKLVGRIGEKDAERNIPGLFVPSPSLDLAVAPDGLLRVANPGFQRIDAYTFDGDLEFSWGEASMAIEGFSGCHNPVNFALLPDGRFVTCEKGLSRVKIYDADGVFESVVAGAELFALREEFPTPAQQSGGQAEVLDVAVDSQGRILVLDPMEKAVRIFLEVR